MRDRYNWKLLHQQECDQNEFEQILNLKTENQILLPSFLLFCIVKHYHFELFGHVRILEKHNTPLVKPLLQKISFDTFLIQFADMDQSCSALYRPYVKKFRVAQRAGTSNTWGFTTGSTLKWGDTQKNKGLWHSQANQLVKVIECRPQIPENRWLLVSKSCRDQGLARAPQDVLQRDRRMIYLKSLPTEATNDQMRKHYFQKQLSYS